MKEQKSYKFKVGDVLQHDTTHDVYLLTDMRQNSNYLEIEIEYYDPEKECYKRTTYPESSICFFIKDSKWKHFPVKE